MSSLLEGRTAAKCTLRILKVLITLILKYAKSSHWENTFDFSKKILAYRGFLPLSGPKPI